MTNKNIIELNGQRYDAVSGKIITEAEVATPVTVKVAPAKTVHSRVQPSTKVRTMDVFGKVKKPAAKQIATPIKQAAVTPAKPSVSRAQPAKAEQHHRKVSIAPVSRSHSKPSSITVRKADKPSHTVAIHTTPHARETSQTLMRRAVSKPAPGFKKSIHVQAGLQSAAPSLIVKKSSVYKVTPDRALRAEATPQSKQISRFNSSTRSAAITVAPVPVQPEPSAPQLQANTPSQAITATTRSTDMFERAIENASHFVDTKAHAKAFHRKRRQQVVSIAAASLALLVIAGFATYLNTPGLQFKVASIKAGVTTTMPNLATTGFAYNGVRSDTDKLTIGLKGSTSSAQLVQQTTNWSEADLIRQANTGTDASGNPLYNTFRIGSISVYRFSDTSATWIKNGIWYQLSSPTNLTDAQVKALAQNS
ncbi:hypothetical protein EYC59_01130 [Candidatus Saccharibacteria bacterium]|nr:MAG: hypothetical protein EYC59_01130 [Candidatus Saccharibacteria bacterium]